MGLMLPEARKQVSSRPRHVAIIMDGNGRWASRRRRNRLAGHRAGVRAARTVVEHCGQLGIEVLTLFAFSSENWNRPQEEVSGLMRLFVEALQAEVRALHKNRVRLRVIGARDHLPAILRKRIDDAEALTSGNTGMTLVLAVAYGGRWDMVEAVRGIAEKARAGRIRPEDIDDAVVDRHRALAGLPPPDLLVRTGGEKRISNFLLWDIAYTEICFTDTLWPDFGVDSLDQALGFFSQRQRRFGRISEQLEATGD